MEKRLSIAFWVLSASIFMWLYSLSSPGGLPKNSDLFDVVNSISYFIFMGAGSWWTYHFMTLLGSCTINDENKCHWRRMLWKLIACSFILASVPLVCTSISHTALQPWAFSISYLWILSSMMLSLVLHVKIEPDFQYIRRFAV
ncbi:hypothetical protein [Oceanisphaera sp. KMM 10153]|uniref:hypothetical protein n=1 Tax=Oceanisphaera submarina TaxID=3390193 RepID=UPI003974874F